MGRNPAWLNQKQVEVLRWVEDGCPMGGDEEGYERRITARALERRGLIAIKGHGASWSASITKAGLAWLAARPGVPPTDAEVDELICRVQAGDGRLVLPDGRDVEMAHEQLVKMSEHSANRPRGWRLEMRATGPWADRRKEIVFVRHFDDLVGMKRELALDHAAGKIADETYLARVAVIRQEMAALATSEPPAMAPADKVVAKLRQLPETWAKATPAGRVELLNSIYERITVKGREFVSARLTSDAYALGLALALPEQVEPAQEWALARPTGVERAIPIDP